MNPTIKNLVFGIGGTLPLLAPRLPEAHPMAPASVNFIELTIQGFLILNS